MKPLLLVDVDGVTCPFGAGQPSCIDGRFPDEKFVAFVKSTGNEARLKRLQEHFELVWCTGWEDRANDILAPILGLPDLPVVYVYHAVIGHPIHWKYEGIKEFVGHRPYAFIDDDINDFGLTYASFRDQEIPTLWLPIRCSVGLTDEHVAILENFAARAIYSENACEE